MPLCELFMHTCERYCILHKYNILNISTLKPELNWDYEEVIFSLYGVLDFSITVFYANRFI